MGEHLLAVLTYKCFNTHFQALLGKAKERWLARELDATENRRGKAKKVV